MPLLPRATQPEPTQISNHINVPPSPPPKDPLNIRKFHRLNQIHIDPRILRILLILSGRQARKRHNMTPRKSHLFLELADTARTRQAVHDRHADIH